MRKVCELETHKTASCWMFVYDVTGCFVRTQLPMLIKLSTYFLIQPINPIVSVLHDGFSMYRVTNYELQIISGGFVKFYCFASI